MHRELQSLLLAAALFPACAPAREHIIEASRHDLRAYEQSITVPKGKFREVCAALKPGDAFEWSFTASAPSDFNVHYHKGKETIYPARSAGAREGSGVLRVEADEPHCWMWKAAADDVAIRLRVKEAPTR